MENTETPLVGICNHLGSVLTTVSDRKLAHSTNSTTIDWYNSEILSSTDYYAFGSPMPGRNFIGATGYKFGYQGSEKDDEIKGSGNSYTTEFRGLDVRLGRWLSIDPMIALRPWESPYSSMGDNPISRNDIKGNVWGDKNDKARADNVKDVAKDNIKAFKKDIAALNEAYDNITSDWQNAKTPEERKQLFQKRAEMEETIEEKNRGITAMNKTIGTIEKMEKDPNIVFTFSSSGNCPTATTYVPKGLSNKYLNQNGDEVLGNQTPLPTVIMEYQPGKDVAVLAHEITHGGQVMKDLSKNNETLANEVEAYKVGYFFNKSSVTQLDSRYKVDGKLRTIKSSKDIVPNWVKKLYYIDNGTVQEPYGKIPDR